LYEKMFRHYTKKQWDKYPEELDASVLERIPVRSNTDDRYFTDQYQCLPSNGYTAMFEELLNHPSISVKLNTDFFQLSREFVDSYDVVFFTGPIDAYFSQSGLPELEYRSIEFIPEIKELDGYIQPVSVVNYPSAEIPYTRTVEYKHFPNQPNDDDDSSQKSKRTILVHERTTDKGEPYYPVPNERNHAVYSEYKKLAESSSISGKVMFIGRLASYKYFNMDQAVLNALEEFDRWNEKMSNDFSLFRGPEAMSP